MIKQLECDHEARQNDLGALLMPVQFYASKTGRRSVATDMQIEQIRTAQLAVIGAAIRLLAAKGQSNALNAERARLRAFTTADYREHLAIH